MILAHVTGTLRPARAVPLPEGVQLLTVRLPEGGALVAADPLRCHTGEQVVLGGAESSAALLGRNCPADAVVVAVCGEQNR